MMRTYCCILLVTFLVASTAGCDDGPSVGQVSGKVTFRGAPVTEGTVSFTHEEAGYGADAEINSDGTYAVTTDEGGLLVGNYNVAINPPIVMDSSDPNTPPVGVEKAAPNIPKKYRDAAKSGFMANVKEGENQFDFEMK